MPRAAVEPSILFKDMCGLRVIMVGRDDCHWCHVFQATFPEFVPMWFTKSGTVPNLVGLSERTIRSVKRTIGNYARKVGIPADEIPLPILVQVLRGDDMGDMSGLITPASELMSMLRVRGIDAPDPDSLLSEGD